MRPIRFASFHLILLGTIAAMVSANIQLQSISILYTYTITFSPKPLLRCYCNTVLPLVYNPLIDPFILNYYSTFFSLIIYYFLLSQNLFRDLIVLALIL